MKKYASLVLLSVAVLMIPVYLLYDSNSNSKIKESLPFVKDWKLLIDQREEDITYVLAFVDYECKYCQELNQTLNKLGNGPQLSIKKIYLPILSQQSINKAVLARCLRTYSDLENVDSLIYDMPVGVIEKNKYQSHLNNQISFKSCLNSSEISDKITAQKIFASNLGIDRVPTVIINGYKIVGNVPIEDLQYLVKKL